MQNHFKKIVAFILLAISVLLLTVGILKFAFPKFFGTPNYVYIIAASLVYLMQRSFKKTSI